MTLQTLFGQTGHITWVQECARAALIFPYGMLLVRIGGRRAFGQWTALDIIVATVMGSTLSRALTGNAELFGTLAATTLLMVLHWGFAQLATRSPALSRILEGCSVQLGANGRLHSTLLRRHGISPAALDEALRRAGIEKLEQARVVVLEPSGRISVLAGPQAP